MIVIPAVDIRKGKCVQLVQGEPGTDKVYGDPVEAAKRWESEGAELLHVIDLDAAFGYGDNLPVVKRIKSEVGIPVQFGGGVRSLARAKEVLEAGIDRVILGTAAISGPEIIKALNREYGKNRVMVAVDSKGGKVVVKGWTEQTGLETATLIKKLKGYAFGFLVTDVDREGLMMGVDLEEFKSLLKATDARICASGGVTTPDDVKSLREIGVWGCVVGKALYEGKIKLSDVL